MRVISQDRTIDTPYDLSMIWIREQYGYLVMANLPNGEPVILGKYSSRGKALKAMEMLREHNEGVAFLKTIINTEKGTRFVSGLSKTDFDKMTRNYFQFPKDDGVEV